MKKLILLLTLSVMSTASFAKANHPSIDADRDFRFEYQSKSDSQRGIANTEEAKDHKKVEHTEENPEKERDIASDEEVFEKSNDSGIRYWKY